MVMPWFLPLALGIGVLATRGASDYRRDHQWSKASRDAWLLIFFGWVPLVAWICNNLGSRR